MLKNYLKIAFRNILKYKGSSVINLIGLAIGFSCCIIIFLYLQNELTYDSYHENADRIYRVSSTFVTSGEPVRFAIASPALGPRLKEEYPEVEEYVRIISLPQMLFVQKERAITFYEEHVILADPSIFEVFTYEFLSGDPATCLNEPQTIVLTEKLATKYFGDEDPIGKILNVDNDDDMKVTGVIKMPPQNSHLPIDAIASYSSWDGSKEALTWPMFEIVGYTYVLLPREYDLTTFYERWPAFYEKYCAKDGEDYGQVFEPNFIQLEDIRYGSMRFRGDVDVGSKSYLYAFFFIGIFILVLACINTINMTTAHAATRTKEIGIKKVLGSDRLNLILQLLGESFFVAFLAILAAFVFVEIVTKLIPVERLLNFNLQMNLFKNPMLLFGSLGLFVFIGVTSGLYPAFYISSFQPAEALSGTFKSGKKGLFVRRTLVTSQFIISIGVVVLMLFMNAQVNFMRNKDLGFKKENVVIIPIRDNSVAQGVPALKEELLKYPEVISVATGSRPGQPGSGLYRFEGNEGMEEHNFRVFGVGHDYIETLGLEIVAGRDFDRQHPSDSTKAVLVNETLIKAMKWETPIGKIVTQGRFKAEVIGVVKDFNFRSLHNPIEPLLFRMNRSNRGRLLVKLRGESLLQTMELINGKWQNMGSNRPFEYSFLDEEFGRLYEADQRQNQLIKFLSYICALISCLGVLGLSSFNSIRRTKEIAIRKVHGASAVHIVVLFFKEIFILIVIASVVIFPVSRLLINLWLKNFAYRADFNILLFLATAVGALIIAFISAGYHCLKVASANPIQSIRYE